MEDKIPPFKIHLLHGAAFPFGEETRGATDAFTNDALPRNSTAQIRGFDKWRPPKAALHDLKRNETLTAGRILRCAEETEG